MVIKILSHARKSGTFKNIQYDKIILYGVSMSQCYSSALSTLSGHPIEFHEVSVSSSKFGAVFPEWSGKKLDELVGHNVSVVYDVKTYGGKQHVFLSKIELVPSGDSDKSDLSEYAEVLNSSDVLS